MTVRKWYDGNSMWVVVVRFIKVAYTRISWRKGKRISRSVEREKRLAKRQREKKEVERLKDEEVRMWSIQHSYKVGGYGMPRGSASHHLRVPMHENK